MAGQGVNLGYADAMLLVDIINANLQAGRDLADNASLYSISGSVSCKIA
ncbi:hypothetical protein [Alishewanella longhuensis]